MRGRAAFALAVVALALAGCGDDDDSGGGGGGGGSGPPPAPTPAPAPDPAPTSSSADRFFDDVGSSGAQDSPTTALLDSAEMSALIRTARANQSIASELTGLSYDYDVTPADAAAIETTACNSGIDPAIEAIRAEIPGADLSALPALNRLVTETALQCGLGDPAWVDSFSGAVFRLLMSNTTALPTSTGPEPTPLMQNVYTAGCAAIKAGVVQAIKRAFSHRGPAYGLSLAVGSALTECPEYLDGYFGDELRDIIAG